MGSTKTHLAKNFDDRCSAKLVDDDEEIKRNIMLGADSISKSKSTGDALTICAHFRFLVNNFVQ
jgi:hypothetical protein